MAESHVSPVWQVKNGMYNPEANLALLRHYQFAPERSNINCIATLLIKAQMQLPSHDFTQLLQLIPERVQVTCVAPAKLAYLSCRALTLHSKVNEPLRSFSAYGSISGYCSLGLHAGAAS